MRKKEVLDSLDVFNIKTLFRGLFNILFGTLRHSSLREHEKQMVKVRVATKTTLLKPKATNA